MSSLTPNVTRRRALADAQALAKHCQALESRLRDIHATATRSRVRWFRRLVPGALHRFRCAAIARLTEQWR